MEPVAVPHTEFPHTSKLVTDYLYHYHRVAPFYGGNPYEAASYEAAAARIDFPVSRREALVAALGEINGDNPSLDKLARPGTFAVVTGQQAGLFTGPCYTIYKALTAVKLARTLSSRGLNAVPVFWIATEDHDFAEVSHCWGFDASLNPVPFELSGDGDRRPVGTIRLENPPLNQLRATLSALPYGDEVATVAELCYAPGRTLGAAMMELLKRILPECLLYLDPLQPAIRSLSAPLVREALAAADELREKLQTRTQELDRAGYHAQVRVDGASSLLFLLENGRRLPLRKRDGGYSAGERSYTEEELAARAESLSPNALLRPVVQDYILPTVAYVGGPAEIAYFAQSQTLFQALLGRMPVAVPRASFTILDTRAAKLMKRYGLRISDFFHGLAGLEEKIAARLIPPDLEEAILTTTESVAGHIAELREKLDEFDPTLAAALDKSRSKILHQLAKIERKAAREALRRENRAEADAAYLSNLIYPKKRPQERFYTVLPFLARHGLDFPNRVYDNVHLDCRDHLVLTV